MKTKIIKLYEYDELNEKAKEKALNNYRDNNDFPFLYDSLKELLNQLLEQNKIKYLEGIRKLELFYSLSNCQGDGVCFIGAFKWNGHDVYINHNGNYYHKNSTQINLYRYDKEGNEEEATEEIYKEFLEVYFSICDEIKKAGYEEIENDNREENIKEFFIMNEITFRANGEIEHI